MKVKLHRKYAGWTDKGTFVHPEVFIPLRYILNWPDTKVKPPNEIHCDLPNWFIEKNNMIINKKDLL